jgi:hypothetical protein
MRNSRIEGEQGNGKEGCETGTTVNRMAASKI